MKSSKQQESECKVKSSSNEKTIIKNQIFLNLPFLDLEHFYYLLILLVKSATTCLTENKALYLCVTHGNMSYRTEQKDFYWQII